MTCNCSGGYSWQEAQAASLLCLLHLALVPRNTVLASPLSFTNFTNVTKLLCYSDVLHFISKNSIHLYFRERHFEEPFHLLLIKFIELRDASDDQIVSYHWLPVSLSALASIKLCLQTPLLLSSRLSQMLYRLTKFPFPPSQMLYRPDHEKCWIKTSIPLFDIDHAFLNRHSVWLHLPQLLTQNPSPCIIIVSMFLG